MPFVQGFLTLTLFLLVGETFRFLLDWPVSGGVCGLLLLTGWLLTRGGVSEALATASRGLISILIVLIMPGVVGVFFLGGRFSGQWAIIITALVLGTGLSVLTTLLLMKFLAKSEGTSSE